MGKNKMKAKIIYKIKAAVVIAIALGFIVSGVSVFAQTQKQHQEHQISQAIEHYVVVENTSVDPGISGHIVNVTGIFTDELFGYNVELCLMTLSQDEVIPIDVDIIDSIIEDPYYFNYTIQHSGQVSLITVTMFVTDDFTPGMGLPAGEGKLFTVVFDIGAAAEEQIVEISDEILASPPSFYTLSGGQTELIPGYLEILRIPDPPEVPTRPFGPTNGTIGVEYTYKANKRPSWGNNVWYKFSFGDGSETNWTKVPSMNKPKASHTWSGSGTYEVKIKVKNSHDEESNWSESLIVMISSVTVTNITGGMGITASIENIGNDTVTDIDYTISIDGGLFIIPKEKTGTIDTIAAGEIANIHMFVFGIGIGLSEDMPRINVSATDSNGTTVVNSATAIIFLTFVSI